MPDTSWHSVSRWYAQKVGKEGHEYHQQVVLPVVLEHLALKPGNRLLDLACGQGVLSRRLPKEVEYLGLDAAAGLLSQAERLNHNPRVQFRKADITKPWPDDLGQFTHASLILAIQNLDDPSTTFEQLATHLIPPASIVIVMNHPCFRIPRVSSWQIDSSNKTQYRRIDRYLSPLSIPLQIHPGKAKGPTVWTYHQPLSFYTNLLTESGFVITGLDELSSHKTSQGKAAKMENRARAEFPLFLVIKAQFLGNSLSQLGADHPTSSHRKRHPQSSTRRNRPRKQGKH